MSSSDSPRLKVRGADAEDRQVIREITLGAYHEYSQQLRPDYWQSYQEHILDTLAEPGDAEQLVAEILEEPVGTVLFYPPGTSFSDDVEAAMSPDCPEVRLLAVSPMGRGAGVGRALMDACVTRAKESGAPGLVLHTMAMMEAARSLYGSMGFVRSPELDFQPAKEWFVEGFRLSF